ncbi:hypothetical protein BB560_006668 [Smittium megazygosporum]|uniref:Nascent polypeptide-associated complex subunit beta n=1 Tax=Smittium megazygosporum TaxID=133381 RepID=A0A2T9Y2J5_9FUNG|nr:hypothetical protein BB560_006668 [Smittium megazygosporum]
MQKGRMNPQKLAQLQSQARIGGKGTPRRKVYNKSAKPSEAGGSVSEDKKLGPLLKRLNAQPLSGIEEVNMFRQDGKIVNFAHPNVSATAGANTFVISGNSAVKDISEMFPGILPQLGPENLGILQQLLKDFQDKNPQLGNPAANPLSAVEDDDIPDLVQAIDKAGISTAAEDVD